MSSSLARGAVGRGEGESGEKKGRESIEMAVMPVLLEDPGSCCGWQRSRGCLWWEPIPARAREILQLCHGLDAVVGFVFNNLLLKGVFGKFFR